MSDYKINDLAEWMEHTDSTLRDIIVTLRNLHTVIKEMETRFEQCMEDMVK